MRRPLIAIGTSILAVLAGPSAAMATLTEVGQLPIATTPATIPSCPNDPCRAVSRTTGFQAKVGSTTSPFVIPRDGKIVAWTVTMSKPNARQIAFFNTNEGGPASAGIAVMRSGKRLTYRMLVQSPIVQLQPYFGQTAQFPLDQTITVKKGWVVALTVPTWAPVLALNFSSDTSWRASRSKKQCNDTSTQTAHTQVGSVLQYYCLYRTARLTYSATLISTP